MKPKPTKTQKPNKKETTIERGNPFYSDLGVAARIQGKILVDGEIPVHGDSHASSSQ